MTRASWTSPRRLRRAGTGTLIVLGASVLPMFGGGARPAGADSQLSSYTLTATATGIDVTFDQADAPAHPEGTATIPMTSSLLTNGGIGYGLSTIFWPGPLGGNLGSLLPLVVPSQVPQLGTPIPRPDAVSQVINQYGPLLNDPVKAESHSGSAPDASFNTIPGITLISHADDQRVDSQGTVESVSDPAVLSVGNLSSRATTTLKDDIGTAVATTHWLDVDIAGVVHIAKIESRAESHTDGSSAAPSGALTVAGVTVNGMPAEIDETGVHVKPLGIESPLSVDPLNAILDQHGMHMFLTHPDSTASEGSASYSTSSLFFTWHTPQGQDITMTLGGSRVAVTATPPFEIFTAFDPAGDNLPVFGNDFTPPSVLGDLTGISLGPTGSAPSSSAPRARVGTRLPTVLAARTFSGIAAGWLLLGLLAIALVAAGALRLAGGVLDSATRSCPEGRR